MKRLMIVLMMLFPVVMVGQTASTAKEFPLTVHVVGSKWVEILSSGGPGSFSRTYMYLSVSIGDRKYVLATGKKFNEGLLLPGDYKGRLVEDYRPETPYELDQRYLLQFPDGKTQKFKVEAVGEW